MICREKRNEIEEALRFKNVTQVAEQFKVSRNVVTDVKKGVSPKKGLEWEARRKEIAELSKTMSVKEICDKFGISKSRVYAILKKEAV